MNTSNPPQRNLLIFFLTHRMGARFIILFLSLLGSLVGLASPLFQKIFVDQLTSGNGGVPASATQAQLLNGLGLLATLSPPAAIALAFLCTLLAQGFGLLVNYLCMEEGTILQRICSEDLYRKMLGIRPDSMSGTTTVGEVVALFATDVPGATALIDQVLPMATVIIFNFAFAPLAVAWICGIPIWATLLVMSMVLALSIFMAARQSRFFTRFKQLAAERTGLVNEWVQTIRMLRILGWIESFEHKIFKKRVEETENRVAMVTNGQLMNSIGSSVNFIINLIGVASLIYLSGRRPEPGQLFAMLWIFGVFLARLFRQMPWFFLFLIDSTTSMRRIERFICRASDAGAPELLELPSVDTAVVPVPASAPLSLSVRGLNLQIGDKKVLRDVGFDVRDGEFVAIIGEVGAGKSMLVLSLVGETGAVFDQFKIGSVDALTLGPHGRRRFFSYVPQEGFVMSASLRENIAFQYGVGRELNDSIMNSLSLAQLRMGEELQGPGLEIEIGERGVNLSGGQRQRVSLARAHHFPRPVILLDDCLSAVDVNTEAQLERSLLDGAWRGRTRILVTHRLSILNRVDRILFMEDGRIIDSGSFSELMQRSRQMQDFVASIRRSEGETATNQGMNQGLNQSMEAALNPTVISTVISSVPQTESAAMLPVAMKEEQDGKANFLP